MAPSECYQCQGCDRAILAARPLLDDPVHGFPRVPVRHPHPPVPGAPQHVYARVCKRCRAEALLLCTGCCGTWPQTAAVPYHLHLRTCEGLAMAEGDDDPGPAEAENDPHTSSSSAPPRPPRRHPQGRDARLAAAPLADVRRRLEPFQGFLELVKARRWAEAEAVLQAWALANLQQHRPECRDACHCRPCSGAVAWPPLAAGPAAPSAQSQLEHAVAGGTPGDRPLPLYGLWRDRRVPFEEVEVVTLHLALRGKSRRFGLPGMDQGAQRDHALSRLYSQYDPLHRGVFLCLLQGGCPSDGFQYPEEELQKHALATCLHLCLFPNLRLIRCCTTLGLRCLLPLLCGRQLGPGLTRNYLGHPCDVVLTAGSPFSGVWRAPPALVGLYHPQRFWQYGAEGQREGLRRADHFHRVQIGKWLAEHAPHLLQPQAVALEEESLEWRVYQEYGQSLPPLTSLWVTPPRPTPTIAGAAANLAWEAEEGDWLGGPREGEEVHADHYLPRAALAPAEDAELAALFSGLTVRPPKLTPVPDSPLPADLLADAQDRLARSLAPPPARSQA
eukprot:EG_transcript_6646